MPSATVDMHQQIVDNGFAVIRGFLSPQEIEEYRQVSEKIIEIARQGEWSEVRTRGKQFPPWPKDHTPDIWGVSGLLHPDMPENIDKVFQKFYSDPKLLDAAKSVLDTTEDNLVMELMNMLINPLSDFELEWHRDDIPYSATSEEEMTKLKLKDTGTQFNLALYPDECLIVVPASHKRARDDIERKVTSDAPRTGKLADEIVVSLAPGDVVFYNNNILHRARYDSSKKRITLHGSYGHKLNGKSRSMNVLQHGVGNWLGRFEPQNERIAHLKSGLDAIVEENKDKDIKFSLSG